MKKRKTVQLSLNNRATHVLCSIKTRYRQGGFYGYLTDREFALKWTPFLDAAPITSP